MTVIDEILERLKKYPHVRYTHSESGIQVYPQTENGFVVSLSGREGSFTVFFNGWHEEFTNGGEALNGFAFGLSEECRLKESRIWGLPYKWTVEYLHNGEWEEDSTTGLLLPPVWELWHLQQVRYLQNQLIPPNS